MARCPKCNREIPGQGTFCPYCGNQANHSPENPQPQNPQPQNPQPQNNRVKITLIVAIAAVALTAVIIAGIIILSNINKRADEKPNPTAASTLSTAPTATTAPVSTAAPTTAPPTTAAPTTAAPTTAPPTTAPPTTASDGRYHNTEYGWSVEVPDAWYTYGTIVESSSSQSGHLGSTRFLYKEAFQEMNAGHVFTIYAVPAGSKNDDGNTGGNPSGGFLGRNDKYAYYWWKATDVQYGSNSSEMERQSAEYKTLSDMRQTILDSFKIDG